MRIDVKGRNLPVSDELRDHVAKRFRKVERQVSELASLEVELFEERNPAIPDSQVADANLYLKGVTLRARSASPDIVHSINLVSEEICRQVKRHRDKRRKRRESRGAGAAGSRESRGTGAAAAALNDTPPTLEGEVVLEGDVVLRAEVQPLPPDISSAA
jgi:putative sigma-54 modulation protein